MPDSLARNDGATDTEGREALWLALRGVLQAQRSGPPIVRVDRAAPLVASFAQQRLWFLEKLSQGSAVHNQTVAYRLVGDVVPSAIEHALTEIVRRHEPLRTTLSWSDGRLLQRVHAAQPFVLEREDLRSLGEDARTRAMDEATRALARTPLDADRAPLLRARLFRSSEHEHRLVVTLHHLAFDGWSFDVFMREMCALYAAHCERRPAPLPELPFRYVDWAVWQRERFSAATMDPLLDYWRRELAPPLPVLALPVDRPTRSIAGRPGAWEAFALPQSLSQAIAALAERSGATVYMLLLAAFQALLHRYSGDEDIVVGSPSANRHAPGSGALIGLFVNTLALRTRFAPRVTFRELLTRVKATVLGAYAHQDLPFETLVQALGGPSRIDTTPLFQAMFAFQNLPRTAWRLPGVAIDAWNVDNGTAKFDVTLFMWAAPEGFGGLLEYDTDRYERETARQWLRHFRMLLHGIVRNPDAPIASVPLLDEDERALLLTRWNDTAVPYPRAATIHDVFARRVQERPHAIALRFRGGETTYADLQRRADRLARELHARGVRPGDRVGVSMRRSPALVLALLASLKAGAAYVPVDPAWPKERIDTVLRGVRAILTQGAGSTRVVVTPARAAVHERCHAIDAVASVTGDDAAYVMFTSGSTGVPKGVGIRHRAVLRLVLDANYVHIGNDDVLVQLSPPAFDASTFEIWGALLNGATLAIPDASRLSLDDIGEAIDAFGATVAFLSTGLFEAMVESRVERLAPLRQLLVGGDVLPPRHAERMLRHAPGCRLINCYGPTENTTFSTFHGVGLADCAGGGPIPIGRPVSNSRIYVLDEEHQPVPVGVFGEAYLAGDGVMIGYMGDPDGTRECLVRDPFAAAEAGPMYRTGDIVRWRRDGALEFRGRRDEQVKIRGYRVEPREVELALGRCPIVAACAVVADPDAHGQKRLLAYVTLVSTTAAAQDPVREMREYASSVLPDYLRPSRYVLVDALPLDGNGKVDRTRLRIDALPCAPAAPRGPRNDDERALIGLFECILHVSGIGADDDFFDQGGTSLSALTLVAQIEDRFAVSVPLASFYEHATPAGLASWLERSGRPRGAALACQTDPMLVEIRRGRGEMPLFLVPGGHGGMPEMTLYARVLSHVGLDLAVHGLLAQGLDGRARPHASVMEMASAYIARIRRYQSNGPYALAGECVGGLVALEMAQQLLARGESVALLLLIDTWCPTLGGVLHYRYVERTRTLLAARGAVMRRGMADVRDVLNDHVRNRPAFGPFRTARYAVNVARTLARVAKPWIAAARGVGKPAKGDERMALAEANYVERTMRYRPRRYAGRIAMIACADNHRRGIAAPWRELAGGGLDLAIVPGDHDTYLRETPRHAAALIERHVREAAVVHAMSRHSADPGSSTA